jgi:hypothetical protein
MEVGELFPRAHRLGLRLPSPPPSWSGEAHSLLNEAATVGAPQFVAGSLSKWRPQRRASVGTFFVNYTIMNPFKTLYTTFCRDERRRQDEVELNEEIEYSRCDLGRDDALDKALDELLIEEAEHQMDPGLGRSSAASVMTFPRRNRRDLGRVPENGRAQHQETPTSTA